MNMAQIKKVIPEIQFYGFEYDRPLVDIVSHLSDKIKSFGVMLDRAVKVAVYNLGESNIRNAAKSVVVASAFTVIGLNFIFPAEFEFFVDSMNFGDFVAAVLAPLGIWCTLAAIAWKEE